MSFNNHGEVFELIGPIRNNENLDHNCAMQTFPSEIDDPNYAELNEGLGARLPRRWNPWNIQDVQKQQNSVSTCSKTQKSRKNKGGVMDLPSRSPSSHHKGDPLGLHHKPAWWPSNSGKIFGQPFLDLEDSNYSSTIFLEIHQK